MKRIIIFITFVILFINMHLSSQVVTLKTDFQDTASKVIKNSDGSFSGICIDLMNLIEKNSNYKFLYPKDFTPLQRIEENLKTGDIDVYFALIRNPEREKKCIFVEPLYSTKYILLTNTTDKAVINNIEDFKNEAKNSIVLTVAGSTIVNYIQSLDLKADAGGKNVIDNFEKLKARRSRFMIYQDIALIYEMNKEAYKDKFKIIPIELQKEDLWLVTSNNTSENLRNGLKKVITTLKSSGEWAKVVNKYTKISK